MKQITKKQMLLAEGAVQMNYQLIHFTGCTFNCALYSNQSLSNFQFVTMLQNILKCKVELERDSDFPDTFISIKLYN